MTLCLYIKPGGVYSQFCLEGKLKQFEAKVEVKEGSIKKIKADDFVFV